MKVTTNKYKIYSGGETYVVSARGVMKLDRGGIKVGDTVNFEDGAINAVIDRRSYFFRTNVANVEVINIVVAPEPKPDFLLVDKLIVEARAGGAKAFLTINEKDIYFLS